MSLHFRIVLTLIGWTAGVTFLHLAVNTRVLELGSPPRTEKRFRVGFLPVT
jgi:hypothetical protein